MYVCCKHDTHTLHTLYVFSVGLVLLSSIHEDEIHRDAYHNHMILWCHSISCCALFVGGFSIWS